MKRSTLGLGAAALVALGAGTVATAQILRVDLPQIVARTDDVVFGKIAQKHVIRIDHPVDGPELFFTTLSIEGRSLASGKPVTVDVSFMGGSIDDENGSFNSEAPSADDVKLGNRVVCFYRHTENMGGDFAANEIFGWHGGIYRTFERGGTVVVQGRGDGYAIPTNVTLPDLEARVAVEARKK